MTSIEIALLEVPEEADEAQAAFIRARYVINALFAAYGDPEQRPGAATMTTREVEAALVMALALLHSAESRLKTRKDFRDAADGAAKTLWRNAVVLRENMSEADLASIGLTTSQLN